LQVIAEKDRDEAVLKVESVDVTFDVTKPAERA